MTTLSNTRVERGIRAPGPAPHFFRDRFDAPGGRVPASIEVPGLDRSIRVKIASELEELEGAFQLLAENYQARGYEKPSTKLFRFTPYHVLPGTVTLVAKHE